MIHPPLLRTTTVVGPLPYSNLGRSTQLQQSSARIPQCVKRKGIPRISSGFYLWGGAEAGDVAQIYER